MVHRQIKIRQENNNDNVSAINGIYSPYQYPKFSRYNYPSNVSGGDEAVYTEEKFSFPHWDDEVSPYAVPTKSRLRKHASSPALYGEDIDDFFNSNSIIAGDDDEEVFDINKHQKRIQELKNQYLQQLNQPGNNEDDEEEVDESQLRCEKIQSDIDLARKDQQSDYDQFRNQYSSLHDDLRYLQREIEEFESNCLNGNHKLNNNEECFGYQSEPTSVVTGSLMAAVSMSDDNDDDSDSEGEGDKNIIRNKICKTVKIKTGPRHIISTPSAATAALIHGIKAVIHDVKAIAITHGVESIAHGVVEDIILFEESGNLNLAAASSIADFFVFTIDISGDVGVSCSADSMVLLVAVVVDPLSVDIIL
ncbi:1145_t:CDS:2 [Entrophospora sp. SA101]|nr:1145_t:CDS:2 [Entrophospora sp. SA101]